ncbi:unnamed protein product [Diplocarpon coronariae]|nr:hypothetical protein JHW43_001483 [Diplocarpon mali]
MSHRTSSAEAADTMFQGYNQDSPISSPPSYEPSSLPVRLLEIPAVNTHMDSSRTAPLPAEGENEQYILSGPLQRLGRLRSSLIPRFGRELRALNGGGRTFGAHPRCD